MYLEPSVRWNSLTPMHLRCPTDAYMLVYQIVLYKTTMLLLRIDLVHNLLPLLITGCWLVYQDLYAVIEAVAILQLTNLNIIAALSVAPMAMVMERNKQWPWNSNSLQISVKDIINLVRCSIYCSITAVLTIYL